MTLGETVADLDALLLAAHAEGNSPQLAMLYARAAALAERAGAPEQAAFYLTHALVFALEAGAPEAEQFAARLRSAGRHD